MAKKDDSLHFKMKRNFRAETFIIQSRIFYLGLPGEHLKLLLFIIHLIGDYNDANPSVSQLARFMGKSRAQIHRYLSDLKELGLITTYSRYTDENVQTSNEYEIEDISNFEPLFSLEDIKREDFHIEVSIKSRIERKKKNQQKGPSHW